MTQCNEIRRTKNCIRHIKTDIESNKNTYAEIIFRVNPKLQSTAFFSANILHLASPTKCCLNFYNMCENKVQKYRSTVPTKQQFKICTKLRACAMTSALLVEGKGAKFLP